MTSHALKGDEKVDTKQQSPNTTVPDSSNTPQKKFGMSAFGGGGCPYLNTDPSESTEDCKRSADKPYTDCYYHDYLQLDKILNANKPRSGDFAASPVHDEYLFITIHQAYEIWFKQVMIELDSCIDILGSDILDDRELLKIVSRLQRINTILKLLVEQWAILDTMTPMSYLEFRKYLKPASGFQSVQFRLLENRLGLDRNKRMRYNKKEYTKVLSDAHAKLVLAKESEKPSMFAVLESWLERFPYLQSQDWSFWSQYKSAVNAYILGEKQFYVSAVSSKTEREELDSAYKQHMSTFDCIFDEQKYSELRKEGKVRLSYAAMQAALMIMLYREEPVLQMPFRVLELSMGMEGILTQWRNTHAVMVHRMLGSKMGTGGSSGFHYLRTAASHHKVFSDFFNLSTYMIPRSSLPSLPKSMKVSMNFPQTMRVNKD